MRARNLFLMALAASMTLVACDKNENEMGGPTDMQPKRVTVKLPNLAPTPGTRAVGDAMQNGSQVELTDFKVFFLDASGAPITVPQYNGQDQQVYFSSDDDTWEEIAASGKDLTFHFLPYQTAKVVVVGNQGNIEYATLANQTEDVLNDTENGHPKYTLYGEDELTEGGAPDNESHENVYQASVTWNRAYPVSKSTGSSTSWQKSLLPTSTLL